MEISTEEEALLATAVEAAQNAYAPYSNFKVGAAILTKSGNVYTGCNVENASYGLTTCAERVAVFKAIADSETEIESIALCSEGAAMPCGACRQVLYEFNPELLVIVGDASGKPVDRMSLLDLLPDPFRSNFKKD